MTNRSGSITTLGALALSAVLLAMPAFARDQAIQSDGPTPAMGTTSPVSVAQADQAASSMAAKAGKIASPIVVARAPEANAPIAVAQAAPATGTTTATQAAPVMPAAGTAPAAGALVTDPTTLPAEQTGALAAGGGPAADDAAAQVQRQRVQPLNNAPVWREVNSGNAFYTSLPGREMGVLIQHGGQPWRELRNDTVTWWGGWAVVLAILGLAGYHAWHGMQCLKEPRTGRLIERFTVFERAAHRAMSLSFVALGATGALMLFGKYVLLPVFGYSLFATLASLSKNIHNFVGPLFAVTLVVSFLVFVRDNLPNRHDLEWVRHLGGLLSKDAHVSSPKFNAGEKMWFWVGVFALGAAVTVSGFVLNFPNFEQTRGQMQLAWLVHAGAALVFLCASFGHIYMGLYGVEGAREGMRTGYVDEAWAKEHHDLWYRDVVEGREPRVRSRDADPVITPEGRPLVG